MINTSLLQFKQQIEALKKHIEANKRADALILNSSSEDENICFLRENFTGERVFRYRSNIISLYGVFEHFIDSVCSEYINKLHTICPLFQDLPDVIKNKYYSNWATLNNKLSWPKYSKLSQKDLIKNLYCVYIENRNEIMAECYLHNGGNYKHKIICEIFEGLGIQDFRCIFCEYPQIASILSPDFVKEAYLNNIDQIVDLRNEIAHGARESGIVDVPIFEDYVKYIESYADSLNMILADNLFAKQWEHYSDSNIYRISHVYKDGTIIILSDVSGININEGTEIQVFRRNVYPRFVNLKVEEIRVEIEKGDVQRVVSTDPTMTYMFVSMRVTESCNIGQKIYVA